MWPFVKLVFRTVWKECPDECFSRLVGKNNEILAASSSDLLPSVYSLWLKEVLCSTFHVFVIVGEVNSLGELSVR